MAKRAMMRAVKATLRRNKLRDAYIRLVVTRGVGDLGLDPRKCPVPSVIIIAASIQLYPPSFYARGLDIVTAASPRIAPESLSPRVKSLNYLNNILAKIEGIQAGCIEVLMLNHLGYVCECSGDNIFAVKGRRITTPPPSAGILQGITRDVVMELARKARYEIVESDLTRYDLYTADEVFLTGSAAEIIGVVKIDGRAIGSGRPGPATGELLARFRRLTGMSRAGAKRPKKRAKKRAGKASKKTARRARRRRR